MNAAVATGEADLVGIGRPLCVDTATPKKLLSGEIEAADRWESQLRIGPGIFGTNSPIKLIKALNGFGAQGWYYEQIRLLAADKPADPELGVLQAFLAHQRRETSGAKAWRAAMP
jgi:hypothetical protein